MNQFVKADMKWSSRLFIDQVWPLLHEHIGKGDLLQMEGRPDIELAQLLDMRAGIDGWQLTKEGGLRGIAARVQKGEKAWNTFTIRKSRKSGSETEYAKRRRAIIDESGETYPHLTIHAYALTNEGPILSVGIAKTCDIIAFIDCGLAQTRATDNADFYVCQWGKMKKAGYKVRIITKD